METESRRPHSIFGPLLLIALGVFLFLNNIGVIRGSVWDVLLNLWPLIFIIGGLDGFYRREGFVGSVVGLGIGVIFLMVNFGYLTLSPWDLALRFWPVLLIAFGLDLLVGRRSTWSPFLGILLGAALLGGMLWLAFAAQAGFAPVRSQAATQPLQGAKSGRIELSLDAGQLNLSSGADPANFAEGTLYLYSGEAYDQNYAIQGSQGIYRVDSRHAYPMFGTPFGRKGWEFKLNRSLPMDVQVDQAVGEADLNLKDVKLERLTANLALGSGVITLPPSGEYTARVEQAIGSLVIRVPKQAPVRLQVSKAISSLSLPAGFERSGDVVTSPAARDAKQVAEINLSQAIGRISIESVP